MMNTRIAAAFAATLVIAVTACGGDRGSDDGSGLSGTIESDGSSTVFPVAQAMAEEFRRENRNVSLPVGKSGTGGGFKRFCAGEIPIANASRPIKDSEIALCAQNNVEYVQLHIATDGIAIVVNPANTFAQCIKVDELKKLWAPNSTVSTWQQVNAAWPAEPIKLFGPGTNSGTFDYFTEEVMGESGASRSDYNASEDDNTLVQGVEGEAGGFGYFGFAYYMENQARLRAVAVDGGSGCVMPTPETIANGTYKPLSRPLFVYVTKPALQRPEVVAFLKFYMEHAAELVPQVGYVALAPELYQENVQLLTTGAPAAGDTAAGDTSGR